MSSNAPRGSNTGNSVGGQRPHRSSSRDPSRSRKGEKSTVKSSQETHKEGKPENRATRNEIAKLDKKLTNAKEDLAEAAKLLQANGKLEADRMLSKADYEIQRLESYYQESMKKWKALEKCGEKMSKPGYDGWTKKPSEVDNAVKLEEAAEKFKMDDVKIQGALAKAFATNQKATAEAKDYRENANNYNDKKKLVGDLEKRLKDLHSI
ncbi:hypothetical protein EAE96_007377 [Botrytis aclada]|nr:hypothetical protein EAE96_007377 [Botrytis aclada]